MQPLISVIIPTFNRAALLPGALDSVIAQTTPHPIEALVIDDGSTDHTNSVMQPYLARHSDPSEKVRVRYELRPRGGVVAARNFGVQNTRAPFVAFLDSDDSWAPEKLHEQMTIMERHPAVGVVHTSFRYVNDNRQICDNGPQRPGNPCVGRCAAALLQEDLVIFSSVLMRRSIIDQAVAMEPHGLPFDPRWINGEDYDLLLRAAAVSDFAYVPKPLTLYRMHGSDSAMANLRKVFSYHCRVQIDFAARHGPKIGITQDQARKLAADFLFGRTESVFWRRDLETVKGLCELARELGISDDRFQSLEARASRPAWQYRLKDQLDSWLGRSRNTKGH